MAAWILEPGFAELESDFGSLQAVFRLQGEHLTSDPLSEVILIRRDGVPYYVKRYWGGGKGLRRFFGRPRVKAEWQNLRLFSRWGVPTATVVACGLERRWGLFHRGALITRGLPDTQDLATLATQGDERLSDPCWVDKVSRQLALATRRMHDHGFTHNDLKWRNLLVNDRAELFFIDCPGGMFWFGPFLHYRIIKDLACLDKVAKYHLSRSQRLRFYHYYCGRKQLNGDDRQRIRKVLKFFEGRE